MKRILIVDGDMAVRAQIGRYARLEGYDVAEASDGYTAVALFRQSTFDFVILAVMLPELDGFSVCQTIRSFSQVPILILSERGDEADRIRGLELGADDYVVKPFSPRELMLRISAIMKRGPLLDSMRQRSIEQDGIYIDLIARRVMVDGNQVSLTPKEFDVLALLMWWFPGKRSWIPSGAATFPKIPARWIPTSSRSAGPSRRIVTGSSPCAEWATALRKIMGRIRADHQKPCAARLLMACFCSGPPQGNTGDCALRAGRRLAAPPPRDTHCEAGLSVVQ